MEIARKTQQDLLPTAPPQAPGLDIAGASSPASIVGGDFFDYHTRLDEQRVSIAVGDVSGHGMPAALLMTLTVGLLEAESRDGSAPAMLLAHLDTALKPHCVRSHLNVAVCYARLQSDGALRVANAGGIAPLLRRAVGRVEWLEAAGLPLGIELQGTALRESETHLEPGDALVLITDGLVEAKNEAGEMFGFDRLEQAVASASAGSATVCQEHILKAMRVFTGSVEPEDDVTIVVVVKQ
jgi:sigma-B regulation protein RsbU (phosphoserine phosphatase)